MIPSSARRRVAVERALTAIGEELQGAAIELALAAPFLSRRDLQRWRARVAGWQHRAHQDAALLARLDTILARDTAAGDEAGRVSA
jgi:hypothetical protein